MNSWIHKTALLLVVLLVAAACSGDSSTETTTTDPATGDTTEASDTTDADAPDDSTSETDAGDTEGDSPSGTVRFGINFIPDDWNNLTKPNETYLALVYEKLVTLEADGVTLAPALAESWEETTDSLTLHLREGVTFTDGTPFNADAVVANIDRIRNTPGSWNSIFDSVSEVVVEDPHTVTLQLSRPDQGLLPSLARRGAFMLSPAHIEAEDFTQPVGTGPWTYVPDESTDDSLYVFEHYDDYWGSENVGPQRIEMTVILENEARVNSLMSGELDVAGVDLPSIPQVESAGMDFTTWASLRYHFNMLDLEGAFADESVRKAVCHGINWEEINTAVFDGYSPRKTQRHNPGQVGYNEDVPGYDYDADRARQLLEEAGNPDVSFTMAVPDFQSALGQLFVAQMADIGVEVQLDELTSPQYFSTYQSGDYQAYFNTSSAEDAGIPGYYHFKWSPNGTANPFGAVVPELDEIMERANSATSLEEQAEIYEEFTATVYEMALDCGFSDFPTAVAWNPEKLANVQGQVWFPSHLRYQEIEVLSD